jgi:hypothetical protein
MILGDLRDEGSSDRLPGCKTPLSCNWRTSVLMAREECRKRSLTIAIAILSGDSQRVRVFTTAFPGWSTAAPFFVLIPKIIVIAAMRRH